jgi:peptide/nickel transport system permease protein
MATATADLLKDARIKKVDKPVSQWDLAWGRLRRHRLAMFGLLTLGLITLACIFAPWIAPYPYDEINLDASYLPFNSPGEPGEPMHLLGTDKLGRDIFSRLLYAGRISLGVALVVTILSLLVGTVIGAVSGAFGGGVDSVLMRFTDLRSQDFVEATRSLGANRSRLVFLHLIPNSMAPIIVAGTLAFGAVIIAESALSFLGFGIMPPVPTWGNMLNEARNSPLEYLFVQALSPGFMIFLTVLSINFFGDGLRDALDPRLRGSNT